MNDDIDTEPDAAALRQEAAQLRERVAQLEDALTRCRTIGVAMGIIVERKKVPLDRSFDILITASQHAHAKLAVVAAEIAETGLIPEHGVS